MAELTRRDALALAATLTLQPNALGARAQGSQAGPLNEAQLLKRGVPDRYTNQELTFIGMPVGGCFAGTVYLGGDGQLWNWDIFNVGQVGTISQPNVVYQGDNLREQDGANYVQPPRQVSPFKQRFELFVDRGQAANTSIPTGLSVKFGDVTFRGEYPIGRVEYRKGDSDVEMDLEAFSPFIPLDIDRSSYPATTLTFTVRNVGKQVERCHLNYAFENPVLCYSKRSRSDFEFFHSAEGNRIVVSARSKSTAPKRSEIVMETWASGTYGEWKSTGTAFGTGPQRVKDLPAYMGTIAAGTEFVVNTHQTRNGENVVEGDVHTGTLTSPPFVINREFLSIRVGGGGHAGGTCINLLINGNVVRSLTGDFSNRMSWKSMNVKEFEGQTAVLQIVDSVSAGWGQISVGEIIQADVSRQATELEKAGDFGEFGVEILQGSAAVTANRNNYTIRSDFSLNPGESKQITFLIAWRFPNKPASLPGSTHWYATKWKSVGEVLSDLKSNWKTLSETTKLWNKTWYDSSLPHWFLDRTFVNTSTLATTTCHRLDTEGRFYFWEGVGCCAGTCTHVWGYAQAIARVFPQVERYLREKIDYGAFFNPSGAIDYRGEFGRSVAHDGQISCVLRSYREHLMSKDGSFLRQKWPAIKKSLEWVINEDKDADGILEGGQYNTLDAAWYGPIAWISSLYVAALRAGEAMAKLMNDEPFAQKCAKLAKAGSERLVKDLYNGEFFINKPDPAHPEANNTNIGCHIDQLYGQFWTHQLGLQPVVPAAQAKSAMAALYKHNFYTDIWEYRRKVRGIVGGRWYAMPGEPGLVMCSFPNGGAENATGKGQDAWAAAYFNECMSGFEFQAAATMISQGLVKEGLSVVRAIHDRYSGKLRNPFNEVECSDHYGRAMASYGAYLAITGMQIDSPNRVVTVAPKVKGGKVRCAFIDAHGWGTIDNTGTQTKVEYVYKA